MPALEVSPSSYSFGEILSGSAAIGLITVTNTGTADLTFMNTGTINGSMFDILSTTCTNTLSTQTSCQVEVQFAPTTSGHFTGSINFASNAGSVEVLLQGIGVFYEPIMDIDPSTYFFENTQI